MPHARVPSRKHTSDDGVIARAGQATEDAKLVEIQVRLAAIGEKLTSLRDHETRLRELEAAKAKLLGACLLLGTLAGGTSGWILIATHH
jgi:hypothetical protein